MVRDYDCSKCGRRSLAPAYVTLRGYETLRIGRLCGECWREFVGVARRHVGVECVPGSGDPLPPAVNGAS